MILVHPATEEAEPSVLLEGELTIYTVAEAKEALEAALEGRAALRLNLSRVDELDTAGVQLLTWLKLTAENAGQGLTFHAHSPEVVEVFDLLKVAGQFGDPILLAPAGR